MDGTKVRGTSQNTFFFMSFFCHFSKLTHLKLKTPQMCKFVQKCLTILTLLRALFAPFIAKMGIIIPIFTMNGANIGMIIPIFTMNGANIGMIIPIFTMNGANIGMIIPILAPFITTCLTRTRSRPIFRIPF
jgi:hypothetical protein